MADKAPEQLIGCDLANGYDWDIRVAKAVCLAESRGNELAHNDNPSTGDDSYGLFQINLYGNLRSGRPSSDYLLNGKSNVEYAYNIYQKSGFTPWSTYKSGEYLKYL